jgi:Protein of unknown function (DUF3618)
MTQNPEHQQATGTGPAGSEQPSAAEQAIAADIERTRAELGETVEQLAAKVHVGARAKHAAADLRHRVTHTAAGMTGRARQRAAARGRQLSSQLGQLTAAVPDTAGDRARTASAMARRYWARLAAAAVALALATAAARKLRR